MSRARWALAPVIGFAVVAVSSGPAAAAAPAVCVALQVQGAGGGLSALARVELPSGRVTPVADLGFRVNAIGYAAKQDVAYGLASHGRSGALSGGGHVVTIGRDGKITDRGPLRSPGQALGATAGAVSGTRWYLRSGLTLSVVDVDPASRTYLTVVSTVSLRSPGLAQTVDDFDLGPDGLLHGVATQGRLVTINPADGEVREIESANLGGGRGYGAAVTGPDGMLYVLGEHVRGRSTWFRVSLRSPSSVETIVSPTSMDHTDAAGCLRPGAVPVPPAPAVPPRPAPRSTPTAAIPATPTVPAPPASSAPVMAPPTNPAPSRKRYKTATTVPRAENALDRTEEKRRWGLAVLVLILAGGAGAVRRTRG
ncbi:hypothetical protein SAMN05192558_107246 [Actinokineospora alba]|uniref:DUF6923 domain-containing protein n=1 Tax=Actinokineospora alba TaxID=504798 RepID=A0A1H0R1H2_9PSEU|nr:hypothetical protein [Actinokineospora alba]TDP70297.1 hypothetical protein C8E96_5905 [Actinokineospora alba]SDI34704.1 hypothetical protein SAMN05421871_104245 [Actinokineospora alba]SDP23215.1 hypothetical protein SAMN05192558_107246 [Actinokineospora alba]